MILSEKEKKSPKTFKFHSQFNQVQKKNIKQKYLKH